MYSHSLRLPIVKSIPLSINEYHGRNATRSRPQRYFVAFPERAARVSIGAGREGSNVDEGVHVYRTSTAGLSAGAELEAFREHFGRAILRLEIMPREFAG